MKLPGYLLFILLTACGSAFAQTRADSSFSLLINSSLSFTHANDPHINGWLEKYGYPPEPHVPTSLNFEVAAIPADSRWMYTLRLSSITSGHDLTSFNLSAGLYASVIKTTCFLLFAGASAGYHADIITLNGKLPTAYQELATQYHTSSLALRRAGLALDPAVRAFWYPVHFKSLQLGLFGGIGYAFDFNSQWRLGYYSNDHGKYNHFKKLGKPNDQQKVSEHGFSLTAGLSFRFNLH
jgi:hypothetical protein